MNSSHAVSDETAEHLGGLALSILQVEDNFTSKTSLLLRQLGHLVAVVTGSFLGTIRSSAAIEIPRVIFKSGALP